MMKSDLERITQPTTCADCHVKNV